MSNQIVPFEFGGEQIRPASLDGKPALVLADIARILGYRDAATAGRIVRDHHKGYTEVRTPGGTQQMLVVTEQGFNRLVIRSNAANAEQVQDFITDEVMPQLARTGSYAAPKSLEQRSLELLGELNAEVQRQAAEIIELAPKADAWEELASAEGDYEVADAAKFLMRAGIVTGQRRLFTQLAELGWIFRGSKNAWRVYQDVAEDGWLSELPQSHFPPKTGEKVIDPPQVRVTMRGLERLRTELKPLLGLS